MAWRAGRVAGSGNMASHGALSAGRCVRSFIQTVTLTTSPVLPPAASTMRRRLSSMWWHCASMPSASWPVAGSVPSTQPLSTSGPMRHAAGIGFLWLKPAM